MCNEAVIWAEFDIYIDVLTFLCRLCRMELEELCREKGGGYEVTAEDIKVCMCISECRFVCRG